MAPARSPAISYQLLPASYAAVHMVFDLCACRQRQDLALSDASCDVAAANRALASDYILKRLLILWPELKRENPYTRASRKICTGLRTLRDYKECLEFTNKLQERDSGRLLPPVLFTPPAKWHNMYVYAPYLSLRLPLWRHCLLCVLGSDHALEQAQVCMRKCTSLCPWPP